MPNNKSLILKSDLTNNQFGTYFNTKSLTKLIKITNYSSYFIQKLSCRNHYVKPMKKIVEWLNVNIISNST